VYARDQCRRRNVTTAYGCARRNSDDIYAF